LAFTNGTDTRRDTVGNKVGEEFVEAGAVGLDIPKNAIDFLGLAIPPETLETLQESARQRRALAFAHRVYRQTEIPAVHHLLHKG